MSLAETLAAELAGPNGAAAKNRKPARLLPHALDAELSILGGVLLYPKAIAEVRQHVAGGDFYHPVHAAIFGAMEQLDTDSRPIDSIHVAEEMKRQETWHRLRTFNGESYFAELTSAVVTVENIGWHAKLVAGKARMRRAIESAMEIAASAYDDHGEPDAFLAQAEERFALAIRTRGGSAGSRPIAQVVTEVVREI